MYLLLREMFIIDLRPQNTVELMLVEHIALGHWKLKRLHKFEQKLHSDMVKDVCTGLAGHLYQVEQALRQHNVEVNFSQWYVGQISCAPNVST